VTCCRTCSKEVKSFEVIKYEDHTGWCSAACFQLEGRRKTEADAVEKVTYDRVHLGPGTATYIDPRFANGNK